VVGLIILVVGVLAVLGVIALTRNEGKSSSPFDGAVPPTTAPPPTNSVTASGQLVAVNAASYAETFTVSTCQRLGKRGVVLLGTGPTGAAVAVSAPDGTGSLVITGAATPGATALPAGTVGATPGGLFLSGRVTSARVGAGGQFDLAGTFDASPTGPTGPFTVTGFCA
jgi:hypothetical protein